MHVPHGGAKVPAAGREPRQDKSDDCRAESPWSGDVVGAWELLDRGEGPGEVLDQRLQQVVEIVS